MKKLTDSELRSRFYSAGTESPLLNSEQQKENLTCITKDFLVLEQLFMSRTSPQETNGVQAGWHDHSHLNTPYAQFTAGLAEEDRLLITLCLLCRLNPEKIWNWTEGHRQGIAITTVNLGGYISSEAPRYLPSLRTAIYIGAGHDAVNSLERRKYYCLMSPLLRQGIITLERFSANEQYLDETDMLPVIGEEHFQFLVFGREVRPDFGKDFPGELVQTNRTWNDLSLGAHTLSFINNIGSWLSVEKDFEQKTNHMFRKGFCCLFYGPPGTGKTLTATLLAQKHQRKVFRVDLSQIVDKYIGETEKKLASLFDRMELFPGSILLFDESDVIFGKRTKVTDSKDRWANLLTGYLLQRIENYNGVSILTTNRKEDIEPAMMRRFDAVVQFRHPDKQASWDLWQKMIPAGFEFESSISKEYLNNYNLSGGEIQNVMKWGAIGALVNNETVIRKRILDIYISHELGKHGLTLPRPLTHNGSDAAPIIPPLPLRNST